MPDQNEEQPPSSDEHLEGEPTSDSTQSSPRPPSPSTITSLNASQLNSLLSSIHSTLSSPDPDAWNSRASALQTLISLPSTLPTSLIPNFLSQLNTLPIADQLLDLRSLITGPATEIFITYSRSQLHSYPQFHILLEKWWGPLQKLCSSGIKLMARQGISCGKLVFTREYPRLLPHLLQTNAHPKIRLMHISCLTIAVRLWNDLELTNELSEVCKVAMSDKDPDVRQEGKGLYLALEGRFGVEIEMERSMRKSVERSKKDMERMWGQGGEMYKTLRLDDDMKVHGLKGIIGTDTKKQTRSSSLPLRKKRTGPNGATIAQKRKSMLPAFSKRETFSRVPSAKGRQNSPVIEVFSKKINDETSHCTAERGSEQREESLPEENTDNDPMSNYVAERESEQTDDPFQVETIPDIDLMSNYAAERESEQTEDGPFLVETIPDIDLMSNYVAERESEQTEDPYQEETIPGIDPMSDYAAERESEQVDDSSQIENPDNEEKPQISSEIEQYPRTPTKEETTELIMVNSHVENQPSNDESHVDPSEPKKLKETSLCENYLSSMEEKKQEFTPPRNHPNIMNKENIPNSIASSPPSALLPVPDTPEALSSRMLYYHPSLYAAKITSQDIVKKLSIDSDEKQLGIKALLQRLKRKEEVEHCDQIFDCIFFELMNQMNMESPLYNDSISPRTKLQDLYLQGLRALIKYRPTILDQNMERIIPFLLKCVENPHYYYFHTAERTLEGCAKRCRNPEQLLRTLNLHPSEDASYLSSLRIFCKLIHRLSEPQLLQLLPEVMPGVISSVSSTNVEYRKAAIFICVEFSWKLGESFEVELKKMTDAQKRLVMVYLEKKRRVLGGTPSVAVQ